MTTTKIILSFFLLIFLSSCSNNNEYKEDSKKTNPNTEAYVSSTAAVENSDDSTRKFIRTADLKFKVKNVLKSTYDIEEITSRHNGFVTYTKLTSNIDSKTNTLISADSTLETTYYTVINTITLRVPNTKLDIALKEISRNIDFLDYRTIQAQDVSLKILANDLRIKRYAKNEERITEAIENKDGELKEATSAEEALLRKQEQADNAKISNLSIEDQINYSTINLSIYQRQTIKRELISNDKNINAYEPSFGSKILESLKFGWHILETFIVFIVKLWGLFLFLIIVYIIYRKYGDKLKK